MKFIGDNIRKFRAEQSLSRKDLARQIRKNGKPIATRTVMNWEAGVNKPDADSLAQMSELFQKDLILFFKPISYQNALVKGAKKCVSQLQ